MRKLTDAERMQIEQARIDRWRKRDTQADPFRPIDEIMEAGRRRGWTMICLEEEPTP